MRSRHLPVLPAVSFAVLLAAFAGLAAPAFGADAEPIPFESEAIVGAARAVEAGGELRLQVPLGRAAALEELVLRRQEVWAPDAEVVVHTAAGEVRQPIPAVRHFFGKIDGEARSRAFLSVLASGEIRGIVSVDGRYWVLGHHDNRADSPLMLREIDAQVEFADKVARFRCGIDELSHGMDQPAGGLSAAEDLLAGALGADGAGFAEKLGAVQAERGFQTNFAARVAIETDQEFLAKFGGSVPNATDYVADLIAYISGVYEDEINTTLVVTHISLWATTDPWAQSSTLCGLLEFGKYWNDNRDNVPRTIAHFLSGKSNGGGIAWVGVLCSGDFNFNATGAGCGALTGTSNYGGAYGYTGDLDANFNPASPGLVWDVFGTSHEIGHNFNSPHTHCYNGIGNALAVDPCYNGECSTGCYCGAQSLPAGCPGSGQGCGTIMSYCHLLGGGFSNISLTFGTGHPYGTLPGRVPTRMNAHVVSTSGTNPSCLSTTTAAAIFANGFESGNTSAWSGSSP